MTGPGIYAGLMAAAFGEAASQQLFVYSEIGPWGIGAEEFAASLAGVDGDIEIHVNSPGGNAFDGLAIYSQLQARPGRVRVVVDGLAASIASVICQAASPGDLVVSPSSVFMIHEAWVDIAAGASELRKQADVLDGMNSVLASIYSDRSGRPQSYWRQAMNAETWYSAPEAVAAGLADRVGDLVPSAAGAVPVAARYARGGVLAAAGGPQVGHDPYGHPLPATFKRQAFAMYEALKREHELRDRAARNGHAVATATGEHSAFAKAVYGVD